MQFFNTRDGNDSPEALCGVIFASHALSDIYDLALNDKSYAQGDKNNLESLKPLNDARWRRTLSAEAFYREYENKYAFHEYPDLAKTLPLHVRHHLNEVSEAVKNFGEVFYAALPEERKDVRRSIDKILAEMEAPPRPAGKAYAARGAEAAIPWIR